MLEATGKSLCILYYVVDSTRPLWQGAVKNCGLVLGTNALVGFAIQLVHKNGTAAQPVSRLRLPASFQDIPIPGKTILVMEHLDTTSLSAKQVRFWTQCVHVTSSASSAITIDELQTTFMALGILEMIVSDNGTCFSSQEFQTFVKQTGIQHVRTKACHPSSNDLAECYV